MLLRAAANSTVLILATWNTQATPATMGEDGACSPTGIWFAMPDVWTTHGRNEVQVPLAATLAVGAGDDEGEHLTGRRYWDRFTAQDVCWYATYR